MSDATVPNLDKLPSDALVTIPQAARLLGAGQSTVWRWLKRPGFPRPIRLSDRATRLRAGDLRKWIASKASV